jgi:hypothetical protein
MESFVLWSLRVWPARGLNNFISAASILRLCEAVKVQFSDPYKNVGKTKVLYNFKMVAFLTFLKIVLLIGIQIQVFLSSGYLALFHKQCHFAVVKGIDCISVAVCSGITEPTNLGKLLYKVVCKWESRIKPVSQRVRQTFERWCYYS